MSAPGKVDPPNSFMYDVIGTQRFITVVTTGKPCGKRSRINQEVLEIKSDGNVIVGDARIVLVETPESLLQVLQSLHQCQYIMPDFVPELLDEDGFQIITQGEYRVRFPNADGRPQQDAAGQYVVSLNDNPNVWRFGSWRVLDRDIDPLTPDLYQCSLDEWVDHANKLLPGVKTAPKVFWPSSKTRVQLIGGSPASSLNGHLWVDCDATLELDCNAFRDRMRVRSVLRGMSWETPRKSRQTGEVLLGKGTHRTLFDLSVWTIHRIIYAGAPTACAGVEVIPAQGWDSPGTPIDLESAMPPLIEQEIADYARIIGLNAKLVVEDGKARLAVNDNRSMTLTSELEFGDGLVMTISQFRSDGKYLMGEKYRCQAMFRESSSLNGIVRKFAGGRVMHHDNGTGVTYWLRDDVENMFDPIDGPNIVPFSEFMRASPEFFYSWRGILMKGWLYALVATPGSGKTAVALYISVMMALGRNIAGRETHPGRVLYLCGENPRDVRMRMEMMLLHYGIDVGELDGRIYFTRRPFAIDQTEPLRRFHEDVQAHGPFDFCVIDTGPAHASTDDENDNRAMHDLAMSMRKLMAPIGMPCTIALMHPAKGAEKGALLPRGGSSFTGSIDGVLCLWREAPGKPSELFAHNQKYRHEHFEPLMFDLMSIEHPTIKDNFGYPVKSVVAELGKKSTEEKIEAEFYSEMIREQLLPFIAAIEHDCEWIGIGKSGTTANNPFKKSWFSHPQYPVVLRGADDDVKRVTYSTIDEMINEGLLVHEKRKQKEGQRERDFPLGLWLTDKGKAALRSGPDLGVPEEDKE